MEVAILVFPLFLVSRLLFSRFSFSLQNIFKRVVYLDSTFPVVNILAFRKVFHAKRLQMLSEVPIEKKYWTVFKCCVSALLKVQEIGDCKTNLSIFLSFDLTCA